MPFKVLDVRAIAFRGPLLLCVLAACGSTSVVDSSASNGGSGASSTTGGGSPTGGMTGGIAGGTSTGPCIGRPDAGEFTTCKTDGQCGCGLSCESDQVLGGTFCEFDCQASADCASAVEVCQSGTCQQNGCGPGTGNGQFDGPCTVTDAGDGFCYPYFESGTSFGLCEQGGSAAVGARCSLNPMRASPTTLCGTNAFCNGSCLLGCDPFEFDVCGTGMVCSSFGEGSSPHLGSCKPGQSHDGGFAASHLPLPQLPFNGGPVINSPKVVTLSFPGYESGLAVGAYADWIVGSDWLKTVGTDYGVGLGTHIADFVLPSAAPAQVSDSQIQDLLSAWMADGGIPSSTANTIYLIYYPVTTTVSASGGVGCESFGGYHDQFDLPNGTPVTYGVIATCKDQHGDPDYDGAAITTSHELLEAATDPDPNGAPAYRFNDLTLAWTYTFSEAADLCAGNTGTYDGYRAQRIWSNSAARAGSTSPCVPAPAGEIYSNVSALPNGTQFLSASSSAQIVTYQITPWSLAQTTAWYIMANPIMGNFSPNLTLTGGTPVADGVIAANNGDTVTLQVTVPPGTPSGSFSGIELISDPNTSVASYTLWPVGVYVK